MANIIWDPYAKTFRDTSEYLRERDEYYANQENAIKASEQSAYQKIGFTPEQVAANFKTLNTVSGALAKSQQAAGYLADNPEVLKPYDESKPAPGNNLLRGIGGAIDKLENSKAWRTVIGNPEEGFGVGDMADALLMANPALTGLGAVKGAVKAVPGVAKAGKAADAGFNALRGIAAKTPTAVKAGLGVGAAATGIETGRGMFDSEYADRRDTLPSQLGSTLRAGTGELLQTAGAFADYMDKPDTGKKLKDAGTKVAKGFEVNRVEEPFSVKSLANPEWWVNNFASSVPSTVALIPLMYAGYKGGKGLAAKAGRSPLNRQ